MPDSANAADTGFPSERMARAYISVNSLVNSLMISHTFLTLLIPLLISLFYFSTPDSRRRPIFILNLVAIFLAIVVGVLIDGYMIHSILNPSNPWPPIINVLFGFVAAVESMLVDCILFVRLISVYPLAHLGPKYFGLLIAIPVLIKVARVINLIFFIKASAFGMRRPDALVAVEAAFSDTPFIRIEWATQGIDNAYASIAFLWRLREGRDKNIIYSGDGRFARRLRTLSRIAATNFVIPVAFSIAQFVGLYCHVNDMILNQLMLTNIMISTFCVAFATVWAGNHTRKHARLTTGLHSASKPSVSHALAVLRPETDDLSASLDGSTHVTRKERSVPVIDIDWHA